MNTPVDMAVDTVRLAIKNGKDAFAVCLDAARMFYDTDDLPKFKKIILDEKFITSKDWGLIIHQITIINKLGFYPNTCKEFVDHWMLDHKISVKAKGAILSEGPVEIHGKIVDENECEGLNFMSGAIKSKKRKMTSQTISRHILIDAMELHLPFDRFLIQMVIDEWFEVKQHDAYTDLLALIEYQSTYKSQEMWYSLYDAIADKNTITPEIAIPVLKKIIWQIKRKMMCRTVTDHLMVIFYGKQGKGKTEFLKMFLEGVIEDLASFTNFADLTDERNIGLLKDNYCLVLDEMARAGKAEMETVKNLITSENVTRRVMRENSSVTFVNNTTLVGASNKKLTQSIQDETGNRRFFEFPYTLTPNYELLNSINMLQLWQSVNENIEDPTTPILAEIKGIQEETSVMGPVAEWVESFKGCAQYYDKQTLYTEYNEWALRFYAKKVLDLRGWHDEMQRLISSSDGFKFIWKRIKDGMRYVPAK